MKLKLLSLHKTDDIPDHILQEMETLSRKMLIAVMPLVDSASPNISLSAINWLLPVIIKHLVTNNHEELRKAAKFSCQMLLANMEILIEQMPVRGNDDHF